MSTLLGVLAWGGLATLLAIAIGRSIAEADKRERPACCPHAESEAPETVRGEFRAVVVPMSRGGRPRDSQVSA